MAINMNSLLFLYGGNQLNSELSFNEQANSLDKTNNEMKVLVYKNVNNDYICPKCGSKIQLDTKKIDNIISSYNSIKDKIIGIQSQLENMINNTSMNPIFNQLKNINFILNTINEDISKNNEKLKSLLIDNNKEDYQQIIPALNLNELLKYSTNPIQKLILYQSPQNNTNLNIPNNIITQQINNNNMITNLKISRPIIINATNWSNIEKVKTDYINESIILNDKDKDILYKWLNPLFNNQRFYLKLLYRRGNDMSFETFHKKCDNKGQTVIICKSKEEKFGGYTNINWESPSMFRAENKDGPFIFSITKNKKYDYSDKSKHSIYLDKDHGPDFNWDFVFNGPKQMEVCYCAIKDNGYAYSSEALIGDGTDKEIEVDEVEVFEIKIIN